MIRWGFRKISVIATWRTDWKETSREVIAAVHGMRYISKVRQVGAWRAVEQRHWEGDSQSEGLGAWV